MEWHLLSIPNPPSQPGTLPPPATTLAAQELTTPFPELAISLSAAPGED